MKTISKILTFTFLSIFIINCSISEEITFNSNGDISYSYLLDAGNLLNMMSDSSTTNKEKKVRDSVFSFARLFEEKKDSIAKLSIPEQEKLATLKPFTINLHQDDNKKEFSVKLSGDFTNTTSLNSALAALNTISNSKDKKGEKGNPMEKMGFLVNSSFDWNGKVLKKTSSISNAMETDSSAQSMTSMFSGGKFKVKYNFSGKVKKVNNPDAVISQNGKSVVIEYDAIEYLTSPELTNLEIELEN